MFFPVLQSKPTSWQGQTTRLCTTRPPESRQPAWLHQSSSALYSPLTLATTTLDFPISKPRISPSAKSAAPSRTLIPTIGTWPAVYAKSLYVSADGSCRSTRGGAGAAGHFTFAATQRRERLPVPRLRGGRRSPGRPVGRFGNARGPGQPPGAAGHRPSSGGKNHRAGHHGKNPLSRPAARRLSASDSRADEAAGAWAQKGRRTVARASDRRHRSARGRLPSAASAVNPRLWPSD